MPQLSAWDDRLELLLLEPDPVAFSPLDADVWLWCIKLFRVVWYSVGVVCTESGVESFGGVGGNENRC